MNANHRQAIRDQVRRMFRLDEDYSEFHQLCAQDPLLAFVHNSRAGGLLRGASAFEDLVKTVCTTNCDWRNTKRMCQRLCELDPAGNFPTPEQILRVREARLAEQTSAGYRAKSFRQIARLTADGKLPLDEWAAQCDYERIEAALKSIWGVGPYSRNHMMVLLGRYDAIPVDSEILKYLRATHFQGKPVAAKQAVEPYARYGRFQYLAFKFGRMARHENYINKGGGSPDYARAKRNGG